MRLTPILVVGICFLAYLLSIFRVLWPYSDNLAGALPLVYLLVLAAVATIVVLLEQVMVANSRLILKRLLLVESGVISLLFLPLVSVFL